MMDLLGRILIVDDEAPVLEVLSEYFVTQGYVVETASSGVEALETVQRTHPDLVLLDVRMPGMDGVEVLRKLRALDPRLAVIMVTANEDVALARETLKIGAFDYVSKPFDFRYLDRAVAAGLVQAGGPAMAGAPAMVASAPEPSPDPPFRQLAFAVFRAVRGMSPGARASVGERLEAASLTAARHADGGRFAEAGPWLAEIELLLGIAGDLGDLPTTARSSIEAALGSARKALGRG